MKNLIITFVLISILGICKANSIDEPERTVIAISGLNLRATPTIDGEIIARVPYLDQVALLSEAVSPTDTLGTVNYGDHVHDVWTDHIMGEWVKVKYQDKEGYVFNAYLMYDRWEEPLQTEECQYAISFDGLNCVDNIHRNKDIKWKGIFKNGEGYEMRDVQLSYYMSPDIDLGDWFATTTQSEEAPLFMIGAAGDQFSNGPVEGTYFDGGNYFDYSMDSATVENITIHFLEEEAYLTIDEGDQQQKVILDYGIQILWKGDLDGDGKNDYVFTTGEESSSTTLYLSSEAKEGQLVQPVASYFSGYCC